MVKTSSEAKRPRKPFAFDRNMVKFNSQGSDSFFRMSITSEIDKIKILAENKKTKQQWQVYVNTFSEHGPSNIPDEVVLDFLKNALDSAHSRDNVDEEDENKPEVDLVCGDEGTMVMTLMLRIGRIWQPEYHFTMLPVELEPLNVLEAQLKDCHEEIAELKQDLQKLSGTSAFFSVSSTTACPLASMVSWDAPAPKVVDISHFQMSADFSQVAIKKDGWYQVYVRLAGTNSANTQSLGLQLNGVDIAQCTQSDANGYQNTAQLTEILHLTVNDVLQVRCGFNMSSITVSNANRFTIMYLRA